MGQTQLLLVIVGVMLVASAIFFGVTMFENAAVDDNRTAVMSDLKNFASRAMAYYGKPAAQGGGDRSFDAATIDRILHMNENVNGRYYVESAQGDSCVVVGVGKAISGTDSVRVRIRVTPQRNTIEIIN